MIGQAEKQLPDFIQGHRDAVAALCRAHGVRRMDLFGSAAGGRFDAGRSDLDFLVQFEAMPPAQHATHFFSLLNGLRELFQRQVDLVEASAVRNPYVRERIQAQQVVVYGTTGLSCRCCAAK